MTFGLQCEDLFDRIDVMKEGFVDWDKFASAILLVSPPLAGKGVRLILVVSVDWVV